MDQTLIDAFQGAATKARDAARAALLRGDFRAAEHKATVAADLENSVQKLRRSTKATQELPVLTCAEVVNGEQ